MRKKLKKKHVGTCTVVPHFFLHAWRLEGSKLREVEAGGVPTDVEHLKGKCIDFSSRAQMKDNWISVPMVYLSLAYGKGNLPYRRFPDPVSMATTGDDAHSA